MRETIKLQQLLSLIDYGLDEENLHFLKNDPKHFDEDITTVYKIMLCLTCDEESWITIHIQNPLLTAFFDLDVYAFTPYDSSTLQVWFTEESVIKMMKKAYKRWLK